MKRYQQLAAALMIAVIAALPVQASTGATIIVMPEVHSPDGTCTNSSIAIYTTFRDVVFPDYYGILVSDSTGALINAAVYYPPAGSDAAANTVPFGVARGGVADMTAGPLFIQVYDVIDLPAITDQYALADYIYGNGVLLHEVSFNPADYVPDCANLVSAVEMATTEETMAFTLTEEIVPTEQPESLDFSIEPTLSPIEVVAAAQPLNSLSAAIYPPVPQEVDIVCEDATQPFTLVFTPSQPEGGFGAFAYDGNGILLDAVVEPAVETGVTPVVLLFNAANGAGIDTITARPVHIALYDIAVLPEEYISHTPTAYDYILSSGAFVGQFIFDPATYTPDCEKLELVS